MSKQKYKTLHGVTYDDADFGRTYAKPGEILKNLDKATADQLIELKAIVKVGADGEDPGESEEMRQARADAEAAAAKEAAKAAEEQAEEQAEEAAKAAKLQAVTAEAEAMNKAKLIEALTKAEVEFDSNANKAALVEAYVANATK